jgi:hypothetical protein
LAAIAPTLRSSLAPPVGNFHSQGIGFQLLSKACATVFSFTSDRKLVQDTFANEEFRSDDPESLINRFDVIFAEQSQRRAVEHVESPGGVMSIGNLLAMTIGPAEIEALRGQPWAASIKKPPKRRTRGVGTPGSTVAVKISHY